MVVSGAGLLELELELELEDWAWVLRLGAAQRAAARRRVAGRREKGDGVLKGDTIWVRRSVYRLGERGVGGKRGESREHRFCSDPS